MIVVDFMSKIQSESNSQHDPDRDKQGGRCGFHVKDTI